jgi:hypothetical protein
VSGPDEVTGQLRAMIADLDGYIGRRAAEVAEPLIAAAKAAADARVAEAECGLQRAQDLVAELRRVLEYRDRQLARFRQREAQAGEARGDLDAVLSRLPPDTRPLPDVAVYDSLLPSRRQGRAGQG